MTSMEFLMADESPALAAIFARTRYKAILAGVGPRRNQLLAAEYQAAVSAVVREFAAWDIPLDWSRGPNDAPQRYREMDLSCVPPGWTVLGAVVQPGGFVWLIAVASQGVHPDRWTMVYEFGCRFEAGGYRSEWVPTGSGTSLLQVRPDEYGTELLRVALVERLATISVARDLNP